MELGLLAYGGYLPKSRLQRAEIARTHGWFNPGLKGKAKGERTMANWDEDAVTMAVEATRDCLSDWDTQNLSGLYMGSTSFPFQDRQNAGIIADALGFPSSILTLDLSSSKRAGSSALAVALKSASKDAAPVVVVGSERSRSKAASVQEMTQADGAAALLVGYGDVIARLVDQHTEAVDFVDHYRGAGEDFDYHWEERWLRDEGYLKIVPQAISRLLEKSGVAASDITTFCMPTGTKRVADSLAKKLGFSPGSVADDLQAVCGETGAAHPLVMLVHALQNASVGDRILVVGFGQGCDVLLFEATEALARLSPRSGITGALNRRRSDTNYARYLAFNNLMSMELGIRAELDKQTGPSTLYRNKEMSQQLQGGCCTKCGTPQFPKSRICVAPNCGAVDTQEAYRFADRPAQINSFTVDQLTYTPDPPNYFGMIQFDGGGRLMSDFTDIDPDADLKVGTQMKMIFRVKDYDNRRGFRRYFWKATPIETDTGAETRQKGE